MKIILKYILLLMLFTNCKAQNNSQKTTKMKTFDIETFNKNKNHLNEYTYISSDSTVTKQSDDDYEYYETIKPKESFFLSINRYYKNRIIKLEGHIFQNFFQKGVWKEYNEQGNLIKEIDYDKPFKFTWNDILKIIKDRELNMDDYGFRITRGSSEKGTTWSITYNKSEEKMLLGVIIIDGITGKIIKEFDEPYPSEE